MPLVAKYAREVAVWVALVDLTAILYQLVAPSMVATSLGASATAAVPRRLASTMKENRVDGLAGLAPLSNSNDNRYSPEPSYDNRNSPEPSYDNRNSPEPSYDNRNSPEPSYDNRYSPEPSYDNRYSPEPSYDNRYSPEPSYDNNDRYSPQPTPTPTPTFSPEPSYPDPSYDNGRDSSPDSHDNGDNHGGNDD